MGGVALDCTHSCKTHAEKMATKNKYSYRGQDYSLLDQVPEDLVCPICHELLDEPQQTVCGHLFCKKCLMKVNQNTYMYQGLAYHDHHKNCQNVQSVIQTIWKRPQTTNIMPGEFLVCVLIVHTTPSPVIGLEQLAKYRNT